MEGWNEGVRRTGRRRHPLAPGVYRRAVRGWDAVRILMESVEEETPIPVYDLRA